MPTCRKCGEDFPISSIINGKRRIFNKRKYCLKCSPFGKRNTLKLERIKEERFCIGCDLKLVGNQTKFCSVKCKSKFYYSHGKKSIKSIKQRERRREKLRKWNIKERKRLYNLRDRAWGTECFICAGNHRLCLHEKRGKKHKSNISSLKKALQEPEKWVRLCQDCHNGVHFCMRKLGWTWEDFEIHIPVSISSTRIKNIK